MIYEKYKGIIKEALASIDLTNAFDEEHGGFNMENFEDFFDCSELPCGWDYSYGASKLVLIPDDLPFVIKIPFNQQPGDYYCDNNEDGERYYPGEVFSSAVYPLCNEYGWDYCRSEAEFYKEAEEAGLSYFFAKTVYIGKYTGYPIYVQEKAKPENTFNCHHSEEERSNSRKKVQVLNIWTDELDDDFLTDLFKCYSNDELVKLFQFLDENDIRDLTSSNVGYDYAGQPIFLDYSDFRD